MKFSVVRHHFIRLSFLAMGAFIAGFALEGFLIPNQMIDGGIVGISMMVHTITKQNLGLIIVCFNVPFIFLALQKLGKLFVAQTLFAIAMLGIGVNIFHHHPATDDLLLATVFGGVVLGL